MTHQSANTPSQHPQPRLRVLAFTALLISTVFSIPNISHAASEGFAGGVTPSRFELNSDHGELVRRSLKIYNLSGKPQKFNVRTVDWSYSEAGEISFSNELTENSCRTWVRLERHRVKILPDPTRPRNFRFEIQIPEDAEQQECRFAIMVENLDSAYTTNFGNGSVSMPVTGRIAVIVYLGVDGVNSEIQIQEFSAHKINNHVLPIVQVKNSGIAHGRLDADLVAIDSNGNNVPLSISTTPIMSQQTRNMTLTPEGNNRELIYPIAVKGKIYAGDETVTVNTTIEAPLEDSPNIDTSTAAIE